MKYTSKNPNGINQIASSSVAISVLNTDVAVFTTSSLILDGALTSSNALITGNVVVLGTASINTLIVNQTKYSSGSNQLGDGIEDTQSFFGTVRIPTGSFTVTGSSFMTGSLTVTSGITGSLFGTSSFAINALTASFVNPLVQNVLITGSLSVSGSTVISGSLQVTQGITGSLFGTSSLALTASFVTPLTQSLLVSGSGNFTDTLTVSSALFTTQLITANSGSTPIYSLPTASYDAVFFDYVIRSGSDSRAGHIMTIWSGSSAKSVDTSTSDFGSTTNLSFESTVSSSFLVLNALVITGSWTIKTIIRGI